MHSAGGAPKKGGIPRNADYATGLRLLLERTQSTLHRLCTLIGLAPGLLRAIARRLLLQPLESVGELLETLGQVVRLVVQLRLLARAQLRRQPVRQLVRVELREDAGRQRHVVRGGAAQRLGDARGERAEVEIAVRARPGGCDRRRRAGPLRRRRPVPPAL